MSHLASNLSHHTVRAVSSMSALRSRRPVRSTARWSAPRPVTAPAAMPTPSFIEETIHQWVDANPPQLYRAGA